MRNDFAVFILTHGRADRVITYKRLREQGYTGRIYLLVDNLDSQIDAYKARYGDEVIVFDKQAIADQADEGDNFNILTTTTHVRNASFDIAKELGLKFFIQLDDDYTQFQYRFDQTFEYNYAHMRSLDRVLTAMVRFVEETGVASLVMAQGGDFIGGKNSTTSERVMAKRKAMNSFICCVDRRVWFLGRMNEDVNTCVTLGMRGQVFLTTNQVSLVQIATQANPGGVTEAYKQFGTYVKSFYTVMYAPSCTRVKLMGNATETMRIHHVISWRHAVPKIVSQDIKKSTRQPA